MQTPATPPDEAQRIAALNATGLLFSPAEERFDRITRLASRLLGAPISVVSLVTESCQWFKSAHGLGARETSREVSFCGHAILGDDTFVVADASQDVRFADNPLVTNAPHIRFYAGHPLHTEDGSRVGTLCVIGCRPRTLTGAELEVLRDLAALAETELQRGQLSAAQRNLVHERDELQRRALTDDLTRLWNRAAIMNLLEAEVARAQRGSPTCVALIDADHFKQVNDRYGHPVGDAVLVELAARIRGQVREFDAAGRYGGEEFMVVLSNCDLRVAAGICERIRHAVAAQPIATTAGPIHASVSIGLFDCGSEGGTSIARAIEAADAALYQAKRNGRNRVEIAMGTSDHAPSAGSAELSTRRLESIGTSLSGSGCHTVAPFTSAA